MSVLAVMSAGNSLPTAGLTLAWIPFLEPIELFHTWWYLLAIPLSLGISIIYKALRLARLDEFWREVCIMTVQIVLGMIGMSAALGVLVQFVIPALPVG